VINAVSSLAVNILRSAMVIAMFSGSLSTPSAQTTATESGYRPPLVVDGHVDVALRVVDKGFDLATDGADTQADIPKWRRGGVNAVFFSIWVHPERFAGEAAPERAWSLIRAVQQQVQAHPNDLVLCDTAAKVRKATASGKIAALMGIEGGVAIHNDLSKLAEYRKAGVRYMTLTWRGNLDWAGSSQGGDSTMGLTDFGREVVREMNRLGIIVDLSHTSDQTIRDAIAITTKPVIFSHSNARVLANHPRNVSDDVLRAVAKNKGLIAVNVVGSFLRPTATGWALRPGPPTVDTVADQIHHIATVAGVDHVGLGTDYEGFIRPASGLSTTAEIPKLWEALKQRGYTKAQIDKIAGGNFLRVIEANER
jgi:membrane dipeptidase